MVGYVCFNVYWKFCKVLQGHDMNNEPMTLQEIAKAEGITHQRVAQILSSALKKIKKALEQKGIKIQDLV
jgi:DNA-directed RNA polymerase sigma subunit (sigma70/sigma32)